MEVCGGRIGAPRATVSACAVVEGGVGCKVGGGGVVAAAALAQLALVHVRMGRIVVGGWVLPTRPRKVTK